MNRRVPSRLCLLALFFLACPLWAGPQLVAEGPWVREAPPGTDVTAGYLRLKNQGEQAVQLASVSARQFGRVVLHETVHDNDSVRMQPLEALVIEPGETVHLEPGGKHLMLHEPRQKLAQGDWVTLTFRFEDGQMLEVTAPVRQRTGREDRKKESHSHPHDRGDH